ncbi:FG-GAP repeat domain-containing protein [Myxococcus landrumensis]|uniref:VCBS repeat-containing protein n=1 Tax=Myxococcus landrumensis TaxID=2813577 RepID=A0ABX7N8K0_9BACT|nr:VCBS repeat-containing protein [Myxococcus landrumus]QSQ13975.1 VCBS repeat-containing protein [Myxococcus landrumus]
MMSLNTSNGLSWLLTTAFIAAQASFPDTSHDVSNHSRAFTWRGVPDLAPPFHIAADGFGDLGARFADVNGDGKQDFLFHRWINGSTVQKGAYVSTGTDWESVAAFAPPFHIAADGYADLGARFADVNGDGKDDFLFHRWINGATVQKGAYLSTGSGWQWAPDFTPPFHIAADGYGDLGARFADVNGDGKQDFLFHRWVSATISQMGAYLSTGSGWQWAPDFTPPFHIAADCYGDLGARFADVNGDGRQDFLFHRWINATTVQKGAYVSTGSGWQWAPDFTPPFHIAGDGFGDLGARFADVNGDGRQDFLFHRWINAFTVQKGAYVSTGSGWQWSTDFTPPFHIAADGFGDLGARFADVNGDGKQDFLFHRWINASTVQKGAYVSTGGGWQWAPEYTPPFHIAAEGFGDLGARFVDLDGDGKQDFAYHRWINSTTVQHGAYLAP